MFSNHIGEYAALLTAFFWTITALAFERASRKVGSLSVNIIRLSMAFVFLGLYSWVTRGLFLPLDATGFQWLWLSLSGLVGFVLGDYFLFRSYEVISARISMLIMALAPPIAALIGWIALDESLSAKQGLGMLLTFAGIALVILKREVDPDKEESESNQKKVKFNYPIAGLLLAFGGAVGQAGGLVLSKVGMQDYNVIAAVQIRVITGIVGFALMFMFLNRWDLLINAVKNPKAMKGITLGAIFGPFLGVTFSLLSIRYTSTGVASAIMSIVPVIIIAPAILIFKEKFNVKEIIGALITVSGVMLFFL
ncbi:MAG: EamA family transporter [Bacteroidales bacterium]|nr:MAG: EamA family transporter [Bacteroidales bacterium]